jgi:dihydroflavonol-4-reductase
MKAFVTGGTGFIGGRLVRKLLERGYEVTVLARNPESAADLEAAGVQIVQGDINNPESMREAMAGSDVVFHAAGWYEVGSPDWMNAELINVAGTRSVLRLAHELGVPRIVYTSTVSVFGNTHGQLVDESFSQGGPFVSEYDRTKWLAHYKVAVPLIAKGAPIIIVMPGGVYGPGDHSWINDAMRLFYQGRMPVIPGPDFTYTYAHVDDIAEGHVLAAEVGKLGESYVLAGPAIPLGEMVDFWAQITGRPTPVIRIPARFLQPLAPLVGSLSSVLPLEGLYSEEVLRTLSYSYIARADKARLELGWRTRSLHEGMTETFHWIADTSPPPTPIVAERERKIAGFALLAAAVLLILWLLSRRQDD